LENIEISPQLMINPNKSSLKKGGALKKREDKTHLREKWIISLSK
jgi:hypothetical protein